MNNIDIVILAMVAVFLALRLRSVLGRRDGAERPEQPLEREAQPIGRPGEIVDAPRGVDAPRAEMEPARPAIEVDASAEAGLAEIARKARDFDPVRFLDGARGAYDMILKAFWAGDKAALEPLLSPDVFKSFSGAIDARIAQGHTVGNRLLGIEKAQIAEARINGSMAEVTVRFEADLVSVTRDAEGKVVEGNLTDSVTVTDLWTFERGLSSRDPAWFLIATREA